MAVSFYVRRLGEMDIGEIVPMMQPNVRRKDKKLNNQKITMGNVLFLFDNQLIAGVENLIKQDKNSLLIISPYIDLDKRIQDALHEHINKHDFHLLVLFGKNENNIYKSIKQNRLLYQ